MGLKLHWFWGEFFPLLKQDPLKYYIWFSVNCEVFHSGWWTQALFLTLGELLALSLLIFSGGSFPGLRCFPHMHVLNNSQFNTWGIFPLDLQSFLCSAHFFSPLQILGVLASLECQLHQLNSTQLKEITSHCLNSPFSRCSLESAGSKLGHSEYSLHLFSISQGSLSFTGWCPMSWVLLFHIFCLVF